MTRWRSPSCCQALEVLDSQVVPGSAELNVRDKTAVAQRLRGAVSSKQFGYEDLLTPLIAQACIDVCPKNPNNFNVDNVRVVKLAGSALTSSQVVRGMLLRRGTEGTVKEVANAKVVVYTQVSAHAHITGCTSCAFLFCLHTGQRDTLTRT